jgi:hypothetical protein
VDHEKVASSIGHTGAVTEPAGNQRAIGRSAAVVGLAGLATIVGGTFAPWVNSGAVSRNLYRITGIAARVGWLGPDSTVASYLPLLGPVCVLLVLLGVLGVRRIAAVLALVLALACGGFAVTTVILTAGRSVLGISLALTGPTLVLIGSVLVIGAALALLVRPRPVTSRTVPVSPFGTSLPGDPSH